MDSHGFASVLLMVTMVSALIVFMGCTTTTVGDVTYTGKEFVVTIDDSGHVSNDTYMQVTMYRISGFSQQEYGIVSARVTLINGKNTVKIPAALSPGDYKLNIYLIRNGERSSAVIRDIRV